MFSEIKKIKAGTKEIRETVLTVGGVLLLLVSGIAIHKAKHVSPYFFFGVSIFTLFGAFLPKLLKPFHICWMAFSIILSFFMSRIVLSIVFYLVVTPMALAARLFGKDILDQRIDKKKLSYWKERTGEKSKESYENQY